MTGDRTIVACNIAEATRIFARGALCYLSLPNPGWGHERVQILGRSRGGRWVQKWEDARRLDHFRLKTIPPEHPRYHDPRVFDVPVDTSLPQWLESAHIRRMVGGVGHQIPFEARNA